MSKKTNHKLLTLQMERFNIDLDKNPKLQGFIESVNDTYGQFDKEKTIQENKSSDLIQKISRISTNLTHATETIDSFNYQISHDLKALIINNISLAKMGAKYFERDNKEKLELILSKLKKNSQLGMEVIEKYLTISKFEAQVKESKPQMVDLKFQINHILKETDLDQKFVVKIGTEDFSEILIDEISIQNILQNFITNAYKYKREGVNPEISFSFESVEEYNWIIAEDNGIGINLKKHKEKIFKPFTRLNNTEIDGSGIGLFIVKKIVSRLNGEIEIKSKLGSGTKFIVKLPK